MIGYLISQIKGLHRKYLERRYIASIPSLLGTVRKKDVITVYFLLHDIAMWKTEALFQAMVLNPRFRPIACPTVTMEGFPDDGVSKYVSLKNYLTEKNYEIKYISDLSKEDFDIIFYEKPYPGIYLDTLSAHSCKKLIGYISYGFSMINNSNFHNNPVNIRSFQYYIENELVATEVKKLMRNNGVNLLPTGIPIMDMLKTPKWEFSDPWNIQDKKKKRIIWAPHFSVTGASFLKLSSFDIMHGFMQSLAKKYEDTVQFAFKPHPLLYETLIEKWGKDKTDDYFTFWKNSENTQLADGEYISLFKYSDAIIHDSGSFLIEYLYMDKPSMYTICDLNTIESYNELARLAYDVYLHGTSQKEVEAFINSVICGEDSKKTKREEFTSKYLMPTSGKSACENIIDAILGQNGYK